jgi:hypothetical protein
MKARCLAVLVLCVAALIGAVACSSGGTAPNGMNAAEIMTMSDNATVNSARFSATIETGMMGETYEMNMVGAVDEASRSMYVITTSSDVADFSMQIYILNDWLYMLDSEYGASWIKTELTEDMWEEQNPVGSQMELLEDSIEAKYLGMETIGEFNCYKIEIIPNWDAIFSATDMEENEGYSTEELTDMIKDTQCMTWIAEDSYYPIQIFFSMTMDMSFLGDMTMDITMTFFDINQPVTITLPAGAKNATEISYDDYTEGDW